MLRVKNEARAAITTQPSFLFGQDGPDRMVFQ